MNSLVWSWNLEISYKEISYKNSTQMVKRVPEKHQKNKSDIIFKRSFNFALLNNFSRMPGPTNFEFGATFSIVVYALNLFWFEFDLVIYIRQ